jgi:hypothetical protein
MLFGSPRPFSRHRLHGVEVYTKNRPRFAIPSRFKWFQQAPDLNEVPIPIDLDLDLDGIDGAVGRFAIDRRALGPPYGALFAQGAELAFRFRC